MARARIVFDEVTTCCTSHGSEVCACMCVCVCVCVLVCRNEARSTTHVYSIQIESTLSIGGGRSGSAPAAVDTCKADSVRRAATVARVRSELSALERRVDELLRAAAVASAGVCVCVCVYRWY